MLGMVNEARKKNGARPLSINTELTRAARANILSGSFREICIGVVSGGLYGKIFVQLFVG
ncbi:MAG: hypothetical protein M1130_01085 [Actinobacteria bacterium]|nr:hypothetical protein [Actinomycetota bacterium]